MTTRTRKPIGTAERNGPPVSKIDQMEDPVENGEYLGTIDLDEGMSDNWMDVAKATGMQGADIDHQWGAKTELEECTPKARPGYHQQWVQVVKDDGSADGARKMHVTRLGFEPRDPATMLPGEVAPIYGGGRNRKSVIGLAGKLVLFEIPMEKYQQLLAAEHRRTNEIYKHIRKEGMTGNKDIDIIASSADSAENLID